MFQKCQCCPKSTDRGCNCCLGARQGPLTQVSEEEQHGHEFFRFPTDYFTLKIVDCQRVAQAQSLNFGEAKKWKLLRDEHGRVCRSDLAPHSYEIVPALVTLPFHPHVPGIDLSQIRLQSQPLESVAQWRLKHRTRGCCLICSIRWSMPSAFKRSSRMSRAMLNASPRNPSRILETRSDMSTSISETSASVGITGSVSARSSSSRSSSSSPSI